MGLYLIEARIGCNVFIKVGITDRRPSKRLAGVATGCPVPPTLIAFDPKASRIHETQIHRRLSYWRSHLEWFHYTGEVVDFVNDMRAAFPVEEMLTQRERVKTIKADRLSLAMKLARGMTERGRHKARKARKGNERAKRDTGWMVGSDGNLAVSRASLLFPGHPSISNAANL